MTTWRLIGLGTMLVAIGVNGLWGYHDWKANITWICGALALAGFLLAVGFADRRKP